MTKLPFLSSSFHSPPPPPHTIIIDWDETLTTEDTIQYLAQVPYINSPQLQPSFSHYTEIYMTNYVNYRSQFGECSTLDDYVRFQSGMEPVEMSSITALEKDGIFRGLTELQIRSRDKLVELRPGAVEFLNRCLALNKEVVILSVNWTSLIIDEVLRRNSIRTESGNGKGIKIVANEFEFDDDEKTTGRWLPSPKIRTSQDKLDYINQIKSDTSVNGDANAVMYVGDSLTDLLPVLNVTYPCAIKDTKLNTLLTQLEIDHFSGTWFDFIKLIK